MQSGDKCEISYRRRKGHILPIHGHEKILESALPPKLDARSGCDRVEKTQHLHDRACSVHAIDLTTAIQPVCVAEASCIDVYLSKWSASIRSSKRKTDPSRLRCPVMVYSSACCSQPRVLELQCSQMASTNSYLAILVAACKAWHRDHGSTRVSHSLEGEVGCCRREDQVLPMHIHDNILELALPPGLDPLDRVKEAEHLH